MSNTKPARLHKKVTLDEKIDEFWNEYKGIIGFILVTFCISILIILILTAASKSGLNFGHLISSDANRYEHMNQIVLYIGGRF